MAKYLGEQRLTDLTGTPFARFTKEDWVKKFLFCRAKETEGEKSRLIDDIARIIYDVPVKVSLARWADGEQEYRFYLGAQSDEYTTFISDYEAGGLYEWETGYDKEGNEK